MQTMCRESIGSPQHHRRRSLALRRKS